jgi:hypothetical protein
MRPFILASDFILSYKTAGVCGSTRRRPVSGRLARSYSDTHLPSYLSSAIGMPDLHKGNRFPIGCAIVAEGIYPALIGSDIGCGITLYPLGVMERVLAEGNDLTHARVAESRVDSSTVH